MSIQNVMATADIAARRRAGVMTALVVLIVLLVLLSLGVGSVRLSPVSVIDALFGGGSHVAQVIVREIRLPRTILGLAIGAILGLSGAAMQGLLRNPLAAPELFGAPQSAAFGAVLVIAFGLADVRSYALPITAIVAAFASVFALLASWKDFLWPLLVLTDPNKQPLSVRLPTIEAQTELGVFLAAMFISCLVPIIGFLIFQRSFLRGGGLGGAIKG